MKHNFTDYVVLEKMQRIRSILYQSNWLLPISPFLQSPSVSVVFVNKQESTWPQCWNNRGLSFWPNLEPRGRWLLMVLQWLLRFKLMPQRFSLPFPVNTKGLLQPQNRERGWQGATVTSFPFYCPVFLHVAVCLPDCPEPCHMAGERPCFSSLKKNSAR